MISVRTWLDRGGRSAHLTHRILSGQPLQNARENTAQINTLDWLPIAIRIDAPRHCFPRLIAYQTDREFVDALSRDDRGSFDALHDERSWRSHWTQYVTCQAHPAGGNISYVVDARLSSDLDDNFFPRGKSLILPTPWLLNADHAANRKDKEIVPGPEEIDCSAILDQIRVVERKDFHEP